MTKKKEELESLRVKLFKGREKDSKMLQEVNGKLRAFLKGMKFVKEVNMTDSKKVKNDFPGGTIIPEEREIKWIKTLEKCQQDLYDIENPVVDKVREKIEGILGELRVMTGDI